MTAVDAVHGVDDGSVGVTVGKFNPPHRGHALLIAEAAARVDVLHVLVCDRPDQTLAAADRGAWLAADAPDHVVVHVTPDDLPDDDSPAWGERTLAVLGGRPDVAFTSEDYGPAWARAMGCRHVAIDPDRTRMPVHGRDLRADLPAGFAQLVPAARAALTRRVVLVGPESSGKTTLARDLAERLGTSWVPEWARTYDAGMQTSPLHGYREPADFVRIARHQAALEDALARTATGVLVCDTDAVATAAWHRRYLGHANHDVEAFARTRRPDLYLLCAPDLPWEDDGTRHSAAHRDEMFAVLRDDLLPAAGVAWEVVEGIGTARLDRAMAHVRAMPPLPTLL